MTAGSRSGALAEEWNSLLVAGHQRVTVFAAGDGVDEPGGKQIGDDRHRHALEAAGTRQFAFPFLAAGIHSGGRAQRALSGIRGDTGLLRRNPEPFRRSAPWL